jgi:hypothetical protein
VSNQELIRPVNWVDVFKQAEIEAMFTARRTMAAKEDCPIYAVNISDMVWVKDEGKFRVNAIAQWFDGFQVCTATAEMMIASKLASVVYGLAFGNEALLTWAMTGITHESD